MDVYLKNALPFSVSLGVIASQGNAKQTLTVNRLKKGNGFPTSVSPVSTTCPSVFLESVFAHISLSLLHLLPLLKPDIQAHLHKCRQFPTWDQQHRKANSSAQCQPIIIYNDSQSFKTQRFYEELEIRASIISNTNLPPLLSTGGTPLFTEAQPPDKDINTKAGAATATIYTKLTLGGLCILSRCYYLELSVYGAFRLQSHLKNLQHSMVYKQDCGCKSCLMIWDWDFSQLTPKARQDTESIGQAVSTNGEDVLHCTW